MNVYLYIAQSNPDAAFEACKKYGYFDVQNIEELAQSLQLIVAQNGEESFKEVMDLHPDKEVLLELFDKKKDDDVVIVASALQKEDCGCKMNATGTTPEKTGGLVNQTNTYILVGALIVAFAVILTKK